MNGGLEISRAASSFIVWSLTEQRAQSCSSEWLTIKYHVFFSFDCFQGFSFLTLHEWKRDCFRTAQRQAFALLFTIYFCIITNPTILFLFKGKWMFMPVFYQHIYTVIHNQEKISSWRKRCLASGLTDEWEVETAEKPSKNVIPTSIKLLGILPKRLLASMWSTCYEVMCVV